MHFQKAFTYIELLIVLTLMIVLYAITTNNVSDLIANRKIEIAKLKILSILSYTKTEAYVNRAPIQFCFANQNDECVSEKPSRIILFRDDENKNRFSLTRIALPTLTGIFYWRLFPRYKKYFTFSTKKIFTNTNGTLWYCLKNSDPEFAIAINKFGKAHALAVAADGHFYDSKHKILTCY